MAEKKAKKKMIVISAVLLFAAAVTAFCISSGYIPWIFVRTYQGDRITIDLYVTVDGEKADIQKDGEGFDLDGREDRSVLKARANEYGSYDFSLIIVSDNGKYIPLTLKTHHYNWWEIVRSELFIDIDTKNDSCAYSEIYKYTSDHFFSHFEKVTTPAETTEGIENIEIWVGNG